MEIRYSFSKIIRHYLKAILYGSLFYLFAFVKSDEIQLKSVNIVFKYVSLIYIGLTLFLFIKDVLKYYSKTYVRIEEDAIFYNNLKIEKQKILNVRVFVKGKSMVYGGLYVAFPFPVDDKKYSLILDLVDDKSVEIDLNNIFLDGNSKENYQKISTFVLDRK